ncbi:MAG: Gmad2 immunoglobulin-like domain-containing protein [Actinomycetota bacterium]|nr:Gmad2 immunoglobulin-like domain-containing protein [Actinomycetota bacterium]
MKLKLIIIFTVAILIFGFSFNSCALISEIGGREEEMGTPAETEETAGEEEEPETASGGERGKEEEKEEAPEVLDEKEEKDIIVESPGPNEVISSPLIITGEARGTWFFEANFTVKLLDGNGEEVAVHYAQALDEWMTEDFVPFRAEIEFEMPETDTGFLILEKNNPSDIREYDDELIVPVRFK